MNTVAIENVLNDPATPYLRWRKLDDGSYIAIVKQALTTAILTNVSSDGFEHRYSYQDYNVANEEFDRISSRDSEPHYWMVCS